MSYTEIFGFNKEGNAYGQADIRNAHRGAMAVWHELEERYLPPYIPDYVKYCNWYRPGMSYDELVQRNGFKPTRMASSFGKDNPMKEVWDLADSDKVSNADKITLFTTFDKCLVKKEDLPKVISAFNEFEGETSLKEQAQVLQTMYEDEDCIAVGWNQTSVNGDTWANIGGYDEEKEESIPYNCLNKADHFWIFDELKLN